jgi:hypothetical protein
MLEKKEMMVGCGQQDRSISFLIVIFFIFQFTFIYLYLIHKKV